MNGNCYFYSIRQYFRKNVAHIKKHPNKQSKNSSKKVRQTQKLQRNSFNWVTENDLKSKHLN